VGSLLHPAPSRLAADADDMLTLSVRFVRECAFLLPPPYKLNEIEVIKKCQWLKDISFRSCKTIGLRPHLSRTGLETTAWRLAAGGLARQILPQARIWRSQILVRIPRIPWILELDSARILTWMPPKLD
jgi:hypothetical protein